MFNFKAFLSFIITSLAFLFLASIIIENKKEINFLLMQVNGQAAISARISEAGIGSARDLVDLVTASLPSLGNYEVPNDVQEDTSLSAATAGSATKDPNQKIQDLESKILQLKTLYKDKNEAYLLFKDNMHSLIEEKKAKNQYLFEQLMETKKLLKQSEMSRGVVQVEELPGDLKDFVGESSEHEIVRTPRGNRTL